MYSAARRMPPEPVCVLFGRPSTTVGSCRCAKSRIHRPSPVNQTWWTVRRWLSPNIEPSATVVGVFVRSAEIGQLLLYIALLVLMFLEWTT